jgi:hypothetical protein
MFTGMKIGMLILFSFVSWVLQSQESGCTDLLASNYNMSAEINDGSCTYPITSYSPLFVYQLPNQVIESSGLLVYDQLLWTHNDSGGQPVLYGLNPYTPTIDRTLRLQNATNVDWEDITRDAQFVYVGDFGNNNGTRRDLGIYKFPLDGLQTDQVVPQWISFSYPDQTNFNSRPRAHDFDMEAMIAYKQNLLLFSKSWSSLHTKLYSIPKEQGDYPAELLDSFNVNGLITGATYVPERGIVALVGYTPFFTGFMWLFWDFQEGNIFSGNKRRIELNLPFHQIEAIDWDNEEEVFWITNERFSNIATTEAKLHKISIDTWIPKVMTGSTGSMNTQNRIMIYPNPASDSIYLYFTQPISSKHCDCEIVDAQGRSVAYHEIDPQQSKVDLAISTLPKGPYLLIIKNCGDPLLGKFIKS